MTKPGFYAQTRDVWTPYEAQSKSKGKGGPVVPESSAYGLTLVGLCLLIAWARRTRNH